MLIPLLLITSLHQIAVFGSEDINKKEFNPSEVLMQYRITGYNNPQRLLANGKTCEDSLQDSSLSVCVVQFVFAVETPGKNTSWDEIGFVQLNEDGKLSEISREQWGSNHGGSFPMKPATLRVIVRGIEPMLEDRRMEWSDMDVFVIPLKDLFPSTQTFTDHTYKGQVMGTSLSLQMSITCSGYEIVGPNCDLKCLPSKIDDRIAECVSVITGSSFVCKYVDDNNTDRQVGNCKEIPVGKKDGTHYQSGTGSQDEEYEVIEDKWGMMAIMLMLFSTILIILFTFVFLKRSVNDENVTSLFNLNQVAE